MDRIAYVQGRSPLVGSIMEHPDVIVYTPGEFKQEFNSGGIVDGNFEFVDEKVYQSYVESKSKTQLKLNLS